MNSPDAWLRKSPRSTWVSASHAAVFQSSVSQDTPLYTIPNALRALAEESDGFEQAAYLAKADELEKAVPPIPEEPEAGMVITNLGYTWARDFDRWVCLTTGAWTTWDKLHSVVRARLEEVDL